MERYAETTKQNYDGWDEFFIKAADDKLSFSSKKAESLMSSSLNSSIVSSWTSFVTWRRRSGCWPKPKWARRN